MDDCGRGLNGSSTVAQFGLIVGGTVGGIVAILERSG